MSDQLMVHAGGWTATKEDLACVPVPPESDSYFPVSYARFIEEMELHIPRFGLRIEREEFALARAGQQMFGVLTCQNGHGQPDYTLAIGLRNSYDRSLAVGLVIGTRVFCCDNLAFSGEVQAARRHTAHVFRDLPDLIYRMLSQVASLRSRIDAEVAGMKARNLTNPEAHHLMVEGVRRHVLPASQLPRLIAAWDRPKYPEFEVRTAWSLYNAFTEVTKSRSPRFQMAGTLRLRRVFAPKLTSAT
jgi:hypothetical protein